MAVPHHSGSLVEHPHAIGGGKISHIPLDFPTLQLSYLPAHCDAQGLLRGWEICAAALCQLKALCSSRKTACKALRQIIGMKDSARDWQFAWGEGSWGAERLFFFLAGSGNSST